MTKKTAYVQEFICRIRVVCRSLWFRWEVEGSKYRTRFGRRVTRNSLVWWLGVIYGVTHMDIKRVVTGTELTVDVSRS